VTRDAGRDPDSDPDGTCARDRHPVDATERRLEPKTGASPRVDPAVRAHDTQEGDYSERSDRGGVEPDVGGRHG